MGRWVTDIISHTSLIVASSLPFLDLEETRLDVDVHDFNVLEGGLVGTSPATRCTAQDALREEAVFAWGSAVMTHRGKANKNIDIIS